MKYTGRPHDGEGRGPSDEDGLRASNIFGARNDQQEAEAALLASADFRHPVNHALVRSARIARLSRDS